MQWEDVLEVAQDDDDVSAWRMPPGAGWQLEGQQVTHHAAVRSFSAQIAPSDPSCLVGCHGWPAFRWSSASILPTSILYQTFRGLLTVTADEHLDQSAFLRMVGFDLLRKLDHDPAVRENSRCARGCDERREHCGGRANQRDLNLDGHPVLSHGLVVMLSVASLSTSSQDIGVPALAALVTRCPSSMS